MLGLLAGFRWFENPRVHGRKGPAARALAPDRLHGQAPPLVRDLGLCRRDRDRLARRARAQPGNRLQGRVAGHVPDAAAAARRRRAHRRAEHRLEPVEGGHPGPRQPRPAASTRASSCGRRRSTRRPGEKLRNELETKLGATHYGSTTVSESFGRQIAKSALWAIFGSLLLIVLYLAIRFDYKYAIPVIAALIHDIVITVGVYSLTGREVTTATVAAVLTVLGYSIYDTIIIFDRIRENVPLMRRASFATIANISLWETIRRSLATTFITLLPVRVAVHLRRRDAEGLRVRAAHRHRLRCVLVDLHRRSAADDPQGARAGVGTRRRGWLRRGRRRRCDARRVLAQAEAAAADEPEPVAVPELAPAIDGGEGNGELSSAQSKRERRRQRRRARPHGRR